MSVEQAFLKAIETSPQSKLLAIRVKKSLRRTRNAADTPATVPPSRAEQRLEYPFNQLGRRWVDLRLGGCSWANNIEGLHAEWSMLRSEMQSVRPAAECADLLGHLAGGAGLRCETLDRRGRDFLVGLLASRPGDCAEVCRIDGVPWFSPFTVLVELVNDLEAHGAQERKALRDFVSVCGQLGRGQDHPARMYRLCLSLADWLAR